MLIDKEKLDKLPPSYKTAVLKLEKDLENALEIKDQRKIIINFVKNFFTIRELWDEIFRIFEIYDDTEEIYFDRETIRERRPLHFCFQYDHPPKALQLGENTHSVCFLIEENEIINAFSYPHKKLDKLLIFYGKFASKPLSKKIIDQCRKMREHYSNILSAEENGDEGGWFDLITDIQDEEFVTSNLNIRLGQNPNSAYLWKRYICFLQKINPKKMLQIYSCYCRYFLDDLGMRENYKSATKIFGPSIIYWENPFEFETFESEIPRESSCFHLRPYFHPPLPPVAKPDFNISESQSFSLPKTLMDYIIKKQKQNPSILHKLHKCCKYFFVILPYPVCHRLIIHDLTFHEMNFPKNAINFTQQSLGIYLGGSWDYSEDPLNPVDFKFDLRFKHHQLIVSNSLFIDRNYCSRNLKGDILPHLFRCHAKHIQIGHQSYTLQEFKFLVEHGNVETLKLEKVKILKSDGSLGSLEEILTFLPKIMDFEINYPVTTSETYKTISELKFINKINRFIVDDCEFEDFKPIEFCAFLKDNIKIYSKIQIKFKDCSFENMKVTKSLVENELMKYWPHSKPEINLYPVFLP